MPPPPAGTVIMPIISAAEIAVTLNWFSICFGKKAAKPAIIRPSEAPAKFRKNNVGFCNNANMALCISRSFEYCLVFDLLCASDIFTCCSFSEPIRLFIHTQKTGDGDREIEFVIKFLFNHTSRYRRDKARMNVVTNDSTT